jgi:LysM repeat protein
MRKIFLSAGHSNTPGRDRGAVGNGYIEGELTVELRNLLVKELKKLNITPIVDPDDSIFSQTINFFKNLVSPSCIVIDIHWNAASPAATGTETLIPANPSKFETELANEISKCISDTLGIPLRGNFNGKRGVKTEAQSHHGRLGWMRLNGENILMEVCFISNRNDMASYQMHKEKLAKELAYIIYKYSMDNQNVPSVLNNNLYTVVRGDTLSKIARKSNTTVNSLKTLNNLNSDVIRVGQVLKIK